ncbi:ASC1-like protein isoform X2 [Arachis ipaensis]|uniref:ASC1-like protein isoform X2 n=1 Tax=Arachis ipaensis TaxID=130454 RepID=UPI000A2B961A|nr:ASC1-like protein isoform X2 [Arachis ipaensis]XP_029145889.1 ASC1-like protein isoform X2 [Arachis hypogaea]
MDLIQQLKSLYSCDWHQESFPDYHDFSILPFFLFFFPCIRFFLDRFVFEKLGRRLIFGKGHKQLDFQNDERRKKIRKFKESAWKCVYFLSAEVFALSVTYDEPWFTNTRNFWVGPGSQVWPDQKIKFARVGSVVLALHDASDVFLEIGKMSKYSGAEIIASIAFILFVLSWVLLRLIYYPFWILWSTSYEVLLTLDKEKHKVDGPIYYYVFNSLLYCLLVLHIYWWVLIFRMLVRQIQARGKLSDDVRSDSEDEDSHED